MLKSILVPLDHKSTSQRRITAAITIGQQYTAHVTGLHVMSTLESMMQTIPYMPYAAKAFNEHHQTMKAQAMALLDHFEESMSHAGLSYERILEEGDVFSLLKTYSRSADLTIINQAPHGRKIGMLDKNSTFMLESGIPVLAVPENLAYPTIGKRILVAWNDSAQCARAVHDALPMIRDAEDVKVLSVGEYEKDMVPTVDICRHLARHGAKVEGLQGDSGDNISEVILAAAEDMNADLIVAGAWGHSRVTEVIMGGVTNGLFTNQILPVFFAH